MKNIAVAALAFGFYLAVTGPAAAQTLKTGYISKDLNYLPFFISYQKKGFLMPRKGLAVELVNVGNSDIELQTLVTGKFRFANINTPTTLIVWNKPRGGKSGTRRPVEQHRGAVFAHRRQEHQAHRRSNGERIGVNSLSGGATSILVAYLRSKGLLDPRDFSMSVITSTPARLSALESGSVAGAVLVLPFSDIAVDKGFTKLGDTTEIIFQLSVQ